MTKLCFETDTEIADILHNMEFARMCLKLKGDPTTHHIEGMRMAFDAHNRASLFMEALRNQANGAKDYERFAEIRDEARKLLDRYNKEFRLTIVENTADTSRPAVVVHAPAERAAPDAKPRQNGGAVDRKPDHKFVLNKEMRKLTADNVRHIKQLLFDIGSTITFEDCVMVRQYYPQVSATNIRAIALQQIWKDVPWPGKPPIYQERKRGA